MKVKLVRFVLLSVMLLITGLVYVLCARPQMMEMKAARVVHEAGK